MQLSLSSEIRGNDVESFLPKPCLKCLIFTKAPLLLKGITFCFHAEQSTLQQILKINKPHRLSTHLSDHSALHGSSTELHLGHPQHTRIHPKRRLRPKCDNSLWVLKTSNACEDFAQKQLTLWDLTDVGLPEIRLRIVALDRVEIGLETKANIRN